MKNPKVVILCGGKGIRLKPLTDNIPKPLVEIGGKPVLHQALELYSQGGFNDFILCIGYKGHLIKEYFSKFPQYKIQYSDSGEDATMIKRINDVKDLIDEKAIIAYGDTYAYLNFNGLISHHNSNNVLMTIVSSPIRSPFGLIDTKENNVVTNFKEKPILSYYMGYSIIEKEAFKYITEDLLKLKNEDGWTLFFKKMIDIEKMGSYPHEGLHLTINTHSQKKLSENIFNYYTDWNPENEE